MNRTTIEHTVHDASGKVVALYRGVCRKIAHRREAPYVATIQTAEGNEDWHVEAPCFVFEALRYYKDQGELVSAFDIREVAS